MFVEVTRLLTVLLLTAAGYYLGRDLDMGPQVAGIFGILGCLFGYLAGGLLGRLLERAAGVAERKVDRIPLPKVVAGVVGGGVGAMVGLTLAIPVALFVRPEVSVPVGGLAMWLCMYLGFRVVARKSEELFALVGLSTRPLVRAQRFEDSDGFVVDTSAVMDGQLLPLVRSGLFRDDMMVPRFVLDELQGMADAGDDRSRRARAGLEILEALRREAPNRVFVLDDEVPEVKEVDAKLVKLAAKLEMRLLTNDVNLAKVAEVQGVSTVIPRRLANDLAPAVVAGETIEVALTRPGRQEGQGVGFLRDGSMVVVNGGADLIEAGPMPLVVSSIVPTAAGQLVFARLPGTRPAEHDDTDLAEQRQPGPTRQT